MKIGLKVRVVNHNFYQAILNSGYKNINEFCIKKKLNQTSIGQFVNLKKCPKDKKLIKKIERYLRLPIEYLFPEELVKEVAKKPQTYFYFEKSVEAIPCGLINKPLEISPQLSSDNDFLKQQIKKCLNVLTDREHLILKLTFGLEDENKKSMDEIGKILNISRTRVDQIKLKALRKLRHPIRAKRLAPFLITYPTKKKKKYIDLMRESIKPLSEVY